MRQEERQAALIRFWLESTRMLDHLMVFQGWLERNRPDLLPLDNVYQTLKSDLRPIRTARRTGVYRVSHAKHPIRDIKLLKGRSFPACPKCSSALQFALIRRIPVESATERFRFLMQDTA